MSHREQWLELYDFRQRVAALYAARNERLERGDPAVDVWEDFRAGRDGLFAHHPQSALDAAGRERFHALSYFPYNPDARVEGMLTADGTAERSTIGTSGDDTLPMIAAGRIRFLLAGVECSLTLYWIDVYGGGLFLPFRDRTAPGETYGGGRYLVDTVKGSDFPRMQRVDGGLRVTLDFNYAYNPSCAYDYRWACPLAPPENHLAVAVRAGERAYASVAGTP